MQDIVLPPKYYLNHFLDLIQEIQKHHLCLLDDEHLRFLEDFSKLGENAKLLFVRMINRKGPLFDTSDFIYPEIENIPSGWEELSSKRFIRLLSEDDIDLFLSRLKKNEIVSHLKQLGLSHRKTAGRDELLNLLTEQKDLLAGFPQSNTHLIVLQNTSELQYILFLYFGNIQSKLILPTLRDLGIKKSNKKAQMGAKFKDKTEALSHYFYAGLKENQKRNFKNIPLDDLKLWPKPLLLESKLIREELLLHLSREEEDVRALGFLRFCEFYPATERRARLLHQMGLLDECQQELERMMDTPSSDEELLFAEDFLQRKFHKKKISLLTETLRNAEKIFIDESFFRHPEFGVVEYFKNLGHSAYFSENYLFTELFWRTFSAELEGRAHSEFDYAPPELKEKTFYNLHASEIENKLTSLTRDSLLTLFEGDEILVSFLEVASLDSVASVLRYISQDYYARSAGYPDLFTIQNGKIIFYEIKAEGDSLKANQLIQMRQLEKAGFEVKVLQVFYRYNANQTYVVVDLETTGTASSYNRITEIGAIKIKGNEIIGTYQTLVNPRRPIPQMIQGLTGITNSMVKDAPPFEEIAESFQDFSKDSIFVAHNVSFDYGFLQNEYSRLEQNFIRPFICTKSGMKKHFPGLDSYGLKNLCAHFNITLESHHRAMCDALAATELLKIINQKRSSSE